MTPLGVAIGPGPVTAFDRTAIERALATVVPAGKQGAVIGVVDTNGTHLLLASRLGPHWAVSADFERRWSGELSGQVSVMGSW